MRYPAMCSRPVRGSDAFPSVDTALVYRAARRRGRRDSFRLDGDFKLAVANLIFPALAFLRSASALASRALGLDARFPPSFASRCTTSSGVASFGPLILIVEKPRPSCVRHST